MSMPKIYTPEEARQLMKIGRSRLYELLRAGILKSVRNGNRYLIPETSIEEFLRTQMQQTAGEEQDDV